MGSYPREVAALECRGQQRGRTGLGLTGALWWPLGGTQRGVGSDPAGPDGVDPGAGEIFGDGIDMALLMDPRWERVTHARSRPHARDDSPPSSRPQDQKLRDQGSAPRGLSPEVAARPPPPRFLSVTRSGSQVGGVSPGGSSHIWSPVLARGGSEWGFSRDRMGGWYRRN